MFTIKIKTGNAAFDDGENGKTEIIRCLDEVKEKLKNGYEDGKIMDTNGNAVGEWKLK